MGARYPDQVGRHAPCVPVVVIGIPCPRSGPFLFCHAVATDAFGRHGATHDLAQRGVGRSGRESVMAGFFGTLWSTRMGV